MKDKFIALAQSQVGVKEEGSTNRVIYSEYFDTTAWQWFNGKKNGLAAWCAIWICWLFCQLIGPEKALSFLGCPKPKDNCAAGVKYLWQYLVARGWKVDKTTGQPGDIIFFNGLKHIGMIEAVEDGKYHTIEGNKSNKVGRGSYGISSSTVYGICRPSWSEIEEPTPEPAPSQKSVTELAEEVIAGKWGNNPERKQRLTEAGYDYNAVQTEVNRLLKGTAPAPQPTPAPAPSSENYKVKTNGSNLRLRVAPNTKAAVLASMPNGSKVIVNGKSGSWSHTTYNGKTGWAFSKWLAKI